MKRIAAVLLIMMLFPGTAGAVSCTAVYSTDGSIKISGESFSDTITVAISKDSEEELNINSDFYLLKEESVSENSFGYSYLLPESMKSGEYFLTVMDESGAFELTFRHISKIEASEVFGLFATRPALEVLDENGEKLGIDMNFFEENKAAVCRAFESYKGSKALDIDSFVSAYYGAVVVAIAANNSGIDEFDSIISTYAQALGIDAEKYNCFSFNTKKEIYSILSKLSSYGDCFADDYYDASFAAKLNTAESLDSFKAVIENEYSSSTSINLAELKGLKYPENVIKKLMKISYTNHSDFESAFVKAVADQKKSESQNSENASAVVGGKGGMTNAFGSNVTTVNEIKNETKAAFLDMENHWANEAVLYLYKAGVINGIKENIFAPDEYVTRAQFSKMVAEAFGITYSSDFVFSDVEKDSWYNFSISAMASAGLIKGDGNGNFKPNDSIKREDAAVILMRTADYSTIKLESNENSFTDADKLSDYAYEAVNLLSGSGVICGTGTGAFEPTKFLTRAEAAQIIYKLLSISR